MENPRKKLYSSLITSADPDVKKHFSQWSADEFDKKLAEDKEFQKDLFLDLRDIGMAKDEATFAKQYLGQAAPSPAAPVEKAAPVAKPVAPAASAVSEGGRVRTEITDTGKKTTSGKILDALSGAVSTVFSPLKAIGGAAGKVVTAAQQFASLKAEDEKFEEAQKKSQAGSVSGFAGDRDLSFIGQYEAAARDKKEKEYMKEQATKPVMSRAAFEGAQAIAPPGLSPQEEKEFKKSQQNYYKVLQDSESSFDNVISKVAKDAQVDKEAYEKDKYGITVPNPLWVKKKAREIAMKGGGEKGGYAETFLIGKIDGLLREYEIKEERDQVEKSLNNGKTIQEAVGEDFAKGVEPFSTYQNRYKLAVKAAEKIAKAEYSPKVEAVTNEYKSALETYKKNVASDPSIRQAVDEYDAQNIARLQEGVNKGVLTVEQANAMLTGKDSMDARNAYINKIVDEKHGKPLNEAYNKYLSNVSVLNNRYNARMRRQDAEEKKYQELQYKKLIETAKKNYNIPQHIIDKYQKIREQANDIVYKRRGLKRAKGDINASIWDNFVSSTLKGLGEGIQSTAYTLGLEDVASFGDLLAKNFETSDLTINSWNDIGFGREGLTKFANSAGSIFGRMGPGMAGSAAVAAATGGAGLGFLPSLFLTSVPSAAFETADIMGSIEQQVLAQGGDIAAAKKASERALKSQIMQFPLYTFDALPFFPKFLKFAGKGKYAALNIAKRAGAGFGINVLTETMQEVPQNLVEEIILEGKDPTFKELVERSTWEKWQNTSASVASLGLLMGAGPQIVDSSKDAIAKRAAAGYFANNILGQASHPALQAQNQTQFLTQLADEKGERFAAQMVNVLFQKGNIDKVKAEALANKLANFQNFKQTTLGQSDNPIVRQAGFILFDKYMEAKNSKNEQAQESALAALNDYARTGNAELVMVRMPDGSFKVYNYDDLNSLMDDEDFQQASRESNDKYGAVFEITPLIQTREGLENPKLQQIIQRFDDIRKAAPEAAKTEAEDSTEVEEIDDAKILEGQKRSGFEVPKLFDIIPVEAAAVVDAVRSREPGVTPDELSGASNAIYQIHKMYEKMRSSTTRNLTLEQIDNITDELEQAITDLENQKTRLAIGDEQMDSLQQQDTESNQTIDTVTAPAEQASQVAPVAAPTVEAEAPAAPQAAPEAAEAEAPAPAKPKAKVNVFTDEDVIDSFSQKESDIYDRLLFDGDEDLANQMIQDKRNELVKKEVELLDVGRISEKVRQSFARAGIDVELLSADEFVRKLKEAGESASRTTEGVFDDNRGKIFINKDALQLGYGTTVVWHEAIHPIMNIIHNSNKALYDKIHKGILANAKANPRGQMADVIKWVESKYNRPGDTDATRKDEIIVEALARLASGRMSFSELQPTLRQQFIDLINRIGRILGLSKAEVSDMKAIKDLAKKITETIKEGRDLSEIVGAENIGKYQRSSELAETQKSIDGRLSEPGIEVPKNEILPKSISESKEESTKKMIDDVLDRFPNALTDRNQWKELMSRVFPYKGPNGEVYIPSFPEGLGRMAKSVDAVSKEIAKVSDEQRRLASEGIKATKEIGDLYASGKMDEVDTGLYFLWNIMSIGISPYPQEAGFLRAVDNGIDQYIKKAANGDFLTGQEVTIQDIDEKTGKVKSKVVDKAIADYYDWVNETLVKNVPGAGSKANLRAFGRNFLAKASQKIKKGEFAGMTRLQALHEILSDRKTPTNELRRKWHANMSAMSFNNKIFDFILLTTGRSDLFVIDRVRTEHFWDAEKLKKKLGIDDSVSIYDGEEFVYGETSSAGYSKMLSDVAGLVFAELANRTMQPLVKKAYEKIGVKESPDVGRFHWETWVAASSQEVSHGSIDAIVQRKRTGEIQNAGIRQGKYGSWDFNFAYRKRAGMPFMFEFKDDNGNTYLFDNLNDVQEEISSQNNKKTYSNDEERFILKDEDGKIIKRKTEDIDKPWYEQEGVDKQKYFSFLRSKAKEIIPAPNVIEDQGVVIGMPEETGKNVKKLQPSLGGREKETTFEPEKKDEEVQRGRSEQTGDIRGRVQGRSLAPLKGAPTVQGISGPDPGLVSAAEEYAKQKGINLKRQSEYVKVDLDRAKRIADAYTEMKHDPNNPRVKRAYNELIKQTREQFDALAKAGYKFSFYDADTDPYGGNPWPAMQDLRNNKKMAVYGTYAGYGTKGITDAQLEENPMLAPTELKWPDQNGKLHVVTANDLFRAVHDAFGHGLEGAGFRGQGEENAWQAHVRLYYGPAIEAMTTETRGQNSWLNYGPYGEANRTAKVEDTTFAENKIGILPEWTWTEGRAGDMEEPGMQPSLGERQAAPSFAELDEILDMSPVKSRAAREKLIDQYGKETVDRMIEISRNFTKIINGLEEQGVVEKDCP